MELARRIQISRRGVFRGALLAAGYSSIVGGSAWSATAASLLTAANQSIVSDVTVATSKFFSPDWDEELVAQFPLRFALGERSAQVYVEISWDARLFGLKDGVIGVDDGETRQITVEHANPGIARFELSPQVSEIIIPVQPLNPYPEENLADVAPSTVKVTDQTGVVLTEHSLAATRTATTTWSLEATVTWVCHAGYVVPSLVSISSIGPAAVPAGTTLHVLYADLLATPTLADEAGSATMTARLDERHTDGMRELILTLTDALPAGAAVNVAFEVTESDARPLPFDNVVPRLFMATPADTTGMRLSRMHTVFPVTAAGSQQSTYLAADKA